MTKELTTEVEYCTFMVAILLTRYYEIYDKNQLQLTPTMVGDKLNALIYGNIPDFHVYTTALHHGLSIHKRILGQMGLACIEVKGTERALKSFYNCQRTRKGYEVILPVLLNDVIIPTKEALLTNILRNRDTVLRLSNYPPSNYTTVKEIAAVLFVNSSAPSTFSSSFPNSSSSSSAFPFSSNNNSSSSSSTHHFSSSSSCSSAYVGAVGDNNQSSSHNYSQSPAKESVMQQHGLKIYKPRKIIEKLSVRQIKNNAEKVLKIVEEMFGVDDAKLYLDAALDVVNKKRKLSGLDDSRVMAKYTVLQNPPPAKMGGEVKVEQKFSFTCPSGQKCPHRKSIIDLSAPSMQKKEEK